MVNLISKAVSDLISLFQTMQLKKFLVVACMSLLLLTTGMPNQSRNQAFSKSMNQAVQQDDDQRPRTTAEWKQEAREVEGQPGERLKRIVEESGDALKDLGEVYPDVAKRSVNDVKDNLSN